MSDDIFAVFDNATNFGPTASNIPIQVHSYSQDANGGMAMLGQRMDTGATVTIRLAELDNREFSLGDKQYDCPPGSLVAIDGALEDPEHGDNAFVARWINRVAKPDQDGSIRFGMARCYYDSRDRFNQFKNKMEVVGAPQPVRDINELTTQAVQAARAASDMGIGWPKVVIAMSSPDGSQGYMRCWNVATSGPRGSKQVADEQGQAAHFQSDAFQRLAQMTAGLMRDKGINVAVHPAADISFGRKRAEMLEKYRSMMPTGAEAQREFVKADNTVNEITRFPIDERGEAMFSPCYFGFQHNERTLVGVRQFSSSGPYFEIAKLPSLDRDMMGLIAQADSYNQTGQNPPPHMNLRGPAADTSADAAAPAPAAPQQDAAPPASEQAPPHAAPQANAATAPVQPPPPTQPPQQQQSQPAPAPTPASEAAQSVPAPSAGTAAPPPSAQPALPNDVDDLTADLDIDDDITAQLEQAASAFNSDSAPAAPSGASSSVPSQG